jgi:DNA-binding transcriptional LysR family regulator
MTLHQLQIFAAVARHLSTTKASEELHLCQPAVSHQLKLLEEECRAKLYTKKTGRGIELTEEGRMFLVETQALLQGFVRLKERFERTPNNTPVVVGGTEQPCVSFLPSAVAAFRESHPKVEVSLRNHTSRELERLVQSGELEIAVITTPSSAPSLTYESYGQAEMVLFVSPTYGLGHKTKFTPADLDGASLVCKRGQRSDEFLEHLRKQGIRFNGVMGCESAETVKGLVRRGMGLGTSYRDHVEQELRSGLFKFIDGPRFKIVHDRYLIYRKERPLSRNALEFLTLLRELKGKVNRSINLSERVPGAGVKKIARVKNNANGRRQVMKVRRLPVKAPVNRAQLNASAALLDSPSRENRKLS